MAAKIVYIFEFYDVAFLFPIHTKFIKKSGSKRLSEYRKNLKKILVKCNILPVLCYSIQIIIIFASNVQYIAYMKIFEFIKQRRLLLGITQQDLADFSGVSLRTIGEIEAGKANPSIKTLNSMVDVLGLEIDLKIKNSNDV
ncbi:hypothetical protein EZS27_040497 [termite gut metagenome]|uniref:HTH cro/C1-type domain-containing protein n=1 Tax=termite gut metagenome TaxID=433724 RepID=A0A5J4PG34_9ZZZZ